MRVDDRCHWTREEEKGRDDATVLDGDLLMDVGVGVGVFGQDFYSDVVDGRSARECVDWK